VFAKIVKANEYLVMTEDEQRHEQNPHNEEIFDTLDFD
jgi:hypothetical protein